MTTTVVMKTGNSMLRKVLVLSGAVLTLFCVFAYSVLWKQMAEQVTSSLWFLGPFAPEVGSTYAAVSIPNLIMSNPIFLIGSIIGIVMVIVGVKVR